MKASQVSAKLKKIISRSDAGSAVNKISRFYEKVGMKSGDEILPFFLSANIIDAKTFRKISKDINVISGAVQKILDAYFNKSMFKKEIIIPKKQEKIIRINKGYESFNILARYDLFVSNNKTKLLEINPESPSGMGRIEMIDKIFLKTKPFIELKKVKRLPDIKSKLLAAFMKTYAEFGGRKKKPTIALVDLTEVKTISDQHYIKEYFKKRGHKTVVCTPKNLKLRNGSLMHGKMKVDIIYRRFLTSDYMKSPKKFKNIIKAMEKGNVCVINPFASSILDDKSFLAKIRDGLFDSVLTKNEIAVIKKILPWSMELNKNAVKAFSNAKKYMIKNKNKLVLKPSIDFGGRGVLIGNQAGKKQWKSAVEKAFKEQKWIAQEYVKIPTIEVPEINNKKIVFTKKYINLSPYMINGKVAGFLTRVSSSKVINTCSGGGIIPTYLVK